MSQQDDLVAAGRRLLTNNYRQAPIVFARGEGCTLFDVDGRRYLDMTAGIAVCESMARGSRIHCTRLSGVLAKRPAR